MEKKFFFLEFKTFFIRIKQLRESGIYDDWMEQFIKDNVMKKIHIDNQVDDSQGLEPLTLDNLSGIFKILFFGLTLSIVVFICEWIHRLFCNENFFVQSVQRFISKYITSYAH
jgi:hypothetical protein